MAWIGFFAGALIGVALQGFNGLLVGGALGIIVGVILRRLLPPERLAIDAAVQNRVASLEQRLAALEARVAGAVMANAPPSLGVTPAVADGVAEPTPSDAVTSTAVDAVPAIASVAAVAAPAAIAIVPAAIAATPLPVRKGGTGAGLPPAAALPAMARAGPATPAQPNRLWAWFTGGNALAKVGVVVLFFGVAFLLSYFAEHLTVPPEVKFAGVAVLGALMVGLGAHLRLARRAYAMALIGGGLGVLYLTTFAALQLVALLTPPVAFALLAAIALVAVVLALRFDSQALAALAAFGGLLAPMLVETTSSPLVLFGYVAVVNATVLAIAWFRSWRWLNVAGFVFTFLLGLWWGVEFYDPEYLGTVEPFLVLFFVAYVAVPLLNVHSSTTTIDQRLDAMLIFGVPMVAFALQATLVADRPYALAWSAGVVAAMYATLWFAFRHRHEGAAATLAAAHGALAVIFTTLVVPLALDPRWTSAIWAIEAAGVYWLGCRQDSRFARGFALLLQVATGVVLAFQGLDADADTAFANRTFLGIVAIALAGFATARFGDRRELHLPDVKRALVPLVFGWACLWWLAGGAFEAVRHVATRLEVHAALAWVIGSVATAMLLARPLRWPRLESVSVVLLPALALAIGSDLLRRHTSLNEYGWAIYALGWTLHFFVLARLELRLPHGDDPLAPTRDPLRQRLVAAHALGGLLLLFQIAWEAGEWVARITPHGTAWAACAHLLPLAAYLLMVSTVERRLPWPLAAFGDAYGGVAAVVVAAALGAGFVALSILHPGDATPLPYVPLINPLDLTLIIALVALAVWGRRHAGTAPRHLQRWIAAGAFVVLNGVVLRTVHHWLHVPWLLDAMIASKTLQAALTLTWTTAALALMVMATRRSARVVWLAGAALLAAAVIKLFVIDLAALSGLTRVVAFLGVGALLLVIAYVAPLPPADAEHVGPATGDGVPDPARPLV
ncbi:MAG: DUF2339 domain-containing protein [Casimicrobiaceae bacterium]